MNIITASFVKRFLKTKAIIHRVRFFHLMCSATGSINYDPSKFLEKCSVQGKAISQKCDFFHLMCGGNQKPSKFSTCAVIFNRGDYFRKYP